MSLKIEFEQAKSLSITESLSLVASQIFGGGETQKQSTPVAGTVADMLAFAKVMNGGG